MMWRPSLGFIGWYWPVPQDWPWGNSDPRYEREKMLVDALDVDRQHTEDALPDNPSDRDIYIWRVRN